MINIPTVLVLGAGASQPFGFPVGDDYKTAILEILDNNQEPAWEQLGISVEQRREVYKQFNASPITSIDLWLQNYYTRSSDPARKELFLRIGKIAIAFVILRKEGQASLNFTAKTSNGSRDWFGYLWRFIDAPLQEFHKNQLSVITFNYDRSFEYSIYNALKSNGDPSDESINECLSKFNLYHVYGTVAPPHYQGEDGGLEFGKFQATSTLERAISNLMIVGERDGAFERFGAAGAHDWLRAAQRIIFLGFGFDNTNTGLFNLKEVALDKPIWVSGLGFDSGDIRRMFSWFSGDLIRLPTLGGDSEDALTFLKDNTDCLD